MRISRISSARARAFAGLWLVWAAGCTGSARNPAGTAGDSGGAPGGSSSGGDPFSEAPHSPLPQLVFQGAPLLTVPQIVTVTFPGDPNADALEAFDDELVTSSYWTTVTAGFCDQSGACVAKGSSGGHVRLTTPPAATYSDSTTGGTSTLQAFIADQITQGLFPPTTPNTLYVLYFPSSTFITLTEQSGQTAATCMQFIGYHNAIVDGTATPVPYAIVQGCPPPQGSGLTPLEALTFTASHEILEAVTDPVQTAKALGYYLDPNASAVVAWNLFAGGEAADLCVDATGLRQDQTVQDGYTVQRIWSDANAANGLDPCVPVAAGDVYFNVAPKGASSLLVLNVGGTATFEADAFSTAPTPSWTLAGVDRATSLHLLKAPLLSFLFNGQKTALVNNGDKVEVTVTLDADPGQLGSAVGVLVSSAGPPGAPTAAHTWPILVVTPSEADGGI
jgi:hypothetical protein